MGSGGLRGLQILRSGVQSVRGGFDSHTFPPILLALALVSFATLARAAAPPDSARTRPSAMPDSLHLLTPAPPDSDLLEFRTNARTRHGLAIVQDSMRAAALNAPRRWSDQPRWVMMRSLVLPGWGQLYNRSYVKASLVAGSEGWLIGALIADRNQLDKLQSAVNAAQAAHDNAAAQAAINAYNSRLDRFVSRQWLLAGVAVYALLDAYVDAHFKNFDIEFRSDTGPPGSPASGTRRLDLRWDF